MAGGFFSFFNKKILRRVKNVSQGWTNLVVIPRPPEKANMSPQTADIASTNELKQVEINPGGAHPHINFLDIIALGKTSTAPEAHVGAIEARGPEMSANRPEQNSAAKEELPHVDIFYLEQKTAPPTIFEKTVDALELTGGALLMSTPGTRIAGALFFAAGVLGAQKHVLENRR